MALMIPMHYTADLSRPLHLTLLDSAFLSGDDQAHRFVIALKEGADPVQATGTVTGYFVRADGATVTIQGETLDGAAILTLPAACYSIPGRFSLVIRLTQGESKTSVFWAEGAVSRSATDSFLDPEHVVPSLDDLLDQIAVMEKATEDAEAAAAEARESGAEAESLAQAAVDDLTRRVDSGEFDGRGFVILGYYTTLDDLISAVPDPSRGDAYGVGSAAPYDIYVWDAVNGLWINNGSLGAVESYEVISMTPSTFEALTTVEKVELYAQGVRMVSVDTDGEAVLHVLNASGGSTPAASGDPIDDTQATTDSTWSGAKISEELSALLLMAHPVGSLYWSSDPTNPADIFGGEWEQITDTFILAAGKRENGATGGAESVTLTVDQLPEHTHTVRVILPSGESGEEGTGFAIDKWGNGRYAYKDNAAGSTGGSAPVDTMPPYLVRYCWERTA